MTTKHTPGPWIISEEQGDNYVISSASNELEICTVWEDPNKADARLIAAAPDLLEALRDGLSACESVSTSRSRRVDLGDGNVSYRQTEEWCKWLENEIAPKIRAAIVKATEERS